jgi:NAD-dependent SIR2 family protein deacetylase
MKIIIYGLILNLIKIMTSSDKNELEKLVSYISTSKAIIIGAGAGLSTSAGFYISGERFQKYFFDFQKKYNIKDMYSGSFYPYTKKSEYWGFMSRNIYLNRFAPFPKKTFNILYEIFKDKNYFILTTNVDHLFQKVGFDKNRMYYMQGDMGLLQCKKPCHTKNYENEQIIKDMLIDQGFTFDEKGELINGQNIRTEISEKLIPKCPVCGGEMDFNLRIGNNFVQDEGWYKHQKLYSDFIDKYKNDDILYIELCVGYNTPSIIKYNFWSQVSNNKKAKFVSINLEESEVPEKIRNRSLVITGDADKIINKIYELIQEYKSDL